MKKIIFILLSCFYICAVGAEESEPQIDGKASVAIKFYDRRIYFPGDSDSEPIFIRVSITNTGTDTLRFKLAEDRSFSIDFSVLTVQNRILPHTDVWMQKRNTNVQVYFREISIEPGETYSFIENLKDYIQIDSPAMYLVSLNFYPELKRGFQDVHPFIPSNRLTLEVQPAPGPAALGALPVSPVTGEVLQPLPIPPDQVIAYILTARQKSRWEQFFLYLDLHKMLSRDPARSRRFKAESESGRYNMIDTYKHELTQERIDKDIAMIPVDFHIEQTTYTATDAEVRVLEWFSYRNFKEKKRFTYYLSSRDGIWYVNNYSVENLGTE
ncbi:hypothetical protein [Treponema phagedenis]|uniref:hypothetical protein n=1 Tax=Treponema phagedenis TaxID=162 RepID=UPI00197F5F9D|nr:hypothetical protein C5O78_05375 [Treponema phagedenis]